MSTESCRSCDVPLIPRSVLFGNPERAGAQVSPDGAHLSWLAPLEGKLNVWVAPADDLAAARPVTHDPHRGIHHYFWAYNARQILYLQDSDGDENYHLYTVDVAGGEARDLTPIDGVRALPLAGSHLHPDHFLVGINDRDPRYHDAWRVDLRTGERELVRHNDSYAGFLVDDDLSVRFALRVTEGGGSDMLRCSAAGDEPFVTIAMEDQLTTYVLGFDRSGETLWFIDSRGRDRAALVAVDAVTGERTRVLAEDEHADINNALIHPTEKTVLAASCNYLRQTWRAVDASVAGDLERLGQVAHGDFDVVSTSLDFRWWVVVYVCDDGPLRYYLYDRGAGTARYLFCNRTALEGATLSLHHPRVVRARDGLELVCYLALPRWADPGGDGNPDAPLPMVLWVHGGPWHRDSWGYQPFVQWLANRGYAVLQVNFRGSTGFGKSFINASNLEWGGKMHDDLLDAVDWAVAEGITRADQVAIGGGSYGGYATLVGVTFTPERFVCGVDIVGPSNLRTLLSTIPPYWEPMRAMWAQRVGDTDTDEGRAFLDERSPLSYVDRIQRPLLIAQGANDPRVKQSESDQIVAAMQARGIPVTYVLFPDEGHGFAQPENSTAFTAVSEAFLAEHLGGRCEPLGDDVRVSTAQVAAGVEGVPGLAEAMA